jgi:urocanate hydratase
MVRRVCLSLDPADLATTDSIASTVMRTLSAECPASRNVVKGHLDDNTVWVDRAGPEQLVVGSQARILYANAEGRIRIALEFNEAIRTGRLKVRYAGCVYCFMEIILRAYCQC